MRPVLSAKKIRKIGHASVIRASYTRSISGSRCAFATVFPVVRVVPPERRAADPAEASATEIPDAITAKSRKRARIRCYKLAPCRIGEDRDGWITARERAIRATLFRR